MNELTAQDVANALIIKLGGCDAEWTEDAKVIVTKHNGQRFIISVTEA